MSNHKAVMLFVGAALLLTSAPAMAQRWGRASRPRDGVCFYKDPNFQGDYFCARVGDSVERMPRGMNDRISSIQIVGRADVTVFQDIRFEGRQTRFDYDVPNLKAEGWNDLISSFRVEVISDNGRRHGGPERGGRPGTAAQDPDRIVQRAYQDILEREPDPQGLRTYRSHVIDDGWTEAQVRDTLRKSEEYREKNTMTYAKATEIVRRAYLAVLKREPDAGSMGYVNRVFKEHWTQQDVERDLRTSPEYRNK